MISSEYKAFSKYKAIAGVDEAGRGPLAGPVVAAAVILPHLIKVESLDDSKKLSKRKRQELFHIIKKRASAYSIAVVDPATIDKINILQATFLAMHNAINNLEFPTDFILVDGLHLPSKSSNIELELPAQSVIRGDEKFFCIAAASILAKVYRDNIMISYDKKFPAYGFKSNKGYPTPQHKKALARFGPCKIHRKSFNPIKNIIKDLH